MLACWKETYDKPRQSIKKQKHHFANKNPYSQSYGFLVVMYRCENRTMKKAEHWRIDTFKLWCQRRPLRVPWTARRSNQSILKKIKKKKENQPWIFIGRTDAKAPMLWPPDAKSQLTGKDPDAGKDWGQKEKVATEDEMVGWHHWLNGHEFEQTRGDSVGQSSAWCATVHGVTKSLTWLNNWTTRTTPTP